MDNERDGLVDGGRDLPVNRRFRHRAISLFALIAMMGAPLLALEEEAEESASGVKIYGEYSDDAKVNVDANPPLVSPPRPDTESAFAPKIPILQVGKIKKEDKWPCDSVKYGGGLLMARDSCEPELPGYAYGTQVLDQPNQRVCPLKY